jgi:hypothetical protein
MGRIGAFGTATAVPDRFGVAPSVRKPIEMLKA